MTAITVILKTGHAMQIDSEDYDRIKHYTLTSALARNGYDSYRYAQAYMGKENGKSKWASIHRLIMNAPEHLVVDHINGNTLDNRRENLRLVTRSENRYNSRKNQSAEVLPKGVRKTVREGKYTYYEAWIGKDGKKLFLGTFKTPTAAHEAWKKKAVELFGDLPYSVGDAA